MVSQDDLKKILLVPVHTVFVLLALVYYQLINLCKQFVPYTMRSKSVKGQVVLVTGSGSGIGRLTAMKLAKLGAKLVLLDVNDKAIKEVEKEIKAENGNESTAATSFVCDLSNRDEIYKVAEQIKKQVGDVDMLVNNAGIVTGKRFLEAPDSLIEKTFQVNVLAHFWLAKCFLPTMLEKNHGHIVTVASVAGHFGAAGLCDYCSSKFAAVGFDESLRNELSILGKDGVITTCINPYYINTGMFHGVRSELIPLLDQNYVADKIVEAILTNQRVLFLPRLMYLFSFMKSFMPCELEALIGNKIFKTNQSMETFVGRNNKSK